MIQNFFETSYKLLNKYTQKTQKAGHYGTDDLLYAAEVHMIDAIGSRDGITTTELAQLLGITKGAVSQTCSKLLDKELIEKRVSAERKTEIYISLTEKGKLVFDYHLDMHRNARTKINSIIDGLSPECLSAMEEVIDALDNMLDEI